MGDVWDWVSDAAGHVVNFISDIGSYAIDSVVAVIGTVVHTVLDVVGFVIPGFDDAIYDLFDLIYDVWDAFGTYLLPIIQIVLNYTQYATWWISAILLIFDDLIEELQRTETEESDEVSKEIHRVWFAVAQRVEAELRRWSQSKQLPDYLLSLVLRITRNKVLEVSNLLGRPYYIAEVEWIGQLRKILLGLRKIKTTGTPALVDIYKIIDDIIYKPYCDTEGALARSWFALFDGLLKTSSDLDKSINKVMNAVSGILHGERGRVTDIMKPKLQGVLDTFTKWISDTYLVDYHKLSDWLDIAHGQVQDNRAAIGDIIERLLRPGSYLTEIDDMSGPTVADQEDMVTDISHRRYYRNTDDLSRAAADTYDKLDDYRKLGQIAVISTPWKKPLTAEIEPAKIDPMERRLTWYVGEF